jgi:hypothetical protein
MANNLSSLNDKDNVNNQVYKLVSTVDFDREMTLVYLMLKEEFSKKRVSEFMSDLNITESMLNPSCTVTIEKLKQNNELIKVPVFGVDISKREGIKKLFLLSLLIFLDN